MCLVIGFFRKKQDFSFIFYNDFFIFFFFYNEI